MPRVFGPHHVVTIRGETKLTASWHCCKDCLASSASVPPGLHPGSPHGLDADGRRL